MNPSTTAGGLPALLGAYPLQGFERSVKLRPGALYAQRCLFGFGRAAIPLADLPALGARLGMPAEYVGEIAAHWAAADAVHFGYEAGAAGPCYKLYLEFSSELKRCGDRPVLLHQAWKWIVGDPRRRRPDRYVCHPGLSCTAIGQRLAALYAGPGEPPSLVAARAVLELAAQRPAPPPMYLEVAEEGSARASFDIRLYDSGLRQHEIAPALLRAAHEYGVAADFGELLAGTRDATPGHLAAGVDRDGGDFLSYYYGAGNSSADRQTNFGRNAWQ
jgi:hypothetical protein